ncbi:MAG: peptidoglycan DL-endopeptidase RipB [Solirubrobacteraceae bacterium]
MRGCALLVVTVACLASAGCGSGDVREIHAWRSGAPYIPPPDPGTAATSGAATPEATKSKPSNGGAPTDAEVARELERAFGTKASRAIDSSGLTAGGLATVPTSAPARVAYIINAANQVARKPYVYGGGHGRLAGETFVDNAYDCSGSVSFALAAAGLLDRPMDSTALSHYGRPGRGRWVTIYANAGHAFMTVAGLRFDTSGRAEGGSRWQARSRTVAGFTVRHPPGL